MPDHGSLAGTTPELPPRSRGADVSTAAPAVLPFSADADANHHSISPGTQTVTYIKRHWRGDLSLPVSYWINGWLLGIGYIVGTSAYQPNPSITSAIGLLILIALGCAIEVWQLIGIWRSASKHTERGGRKIWAYLAQVGVIVGWGNFVRGIFELLGLPGT